MNTLQDYADHLYDTSVSYRRVFDAMGDSIEKVYSTDDCIRASEYGLEAWKWLKKLMTILNVDDLYTLHTNYRTGYDLFYWASEAEMNLSNAVVKDASFFQQWFDFCYEYTAMHADYTDQEHCNLGHIRNGLARCYCKKNEQNRCDQLYEKWLAQDPDWGWGWIGWSDQYWLFLEEEDQDYEKAKAIISRGLQICMNQNDRKHMQDRMREIVKNTLTIIK